MFEAQTYFIKRQQSVIVDLVKDIVMQRESSNTVTPENPPEPKTTHLVSVVDSEGHPIEEDHILKNS